MLNDDAYLLNIYMKTTLFKFMRLYTLTFIKNAKRRIFENKKCIRTGKELYEQDTSKCRLFTSHVNKQINVIHQIPSL